MSEPLLDESLLAGLSEKEREEALSAARAARRAEQRAEQRLLEKAMREKQAQHLKLEQQTKEALSKQYGGDNGNTGGAGKIVFVPKRKRQQQEKISGGAGGAPTANDTEEAEEESTASKSSKVEIKRSNGTSVTTVTGGEAPQLTEKERIALKATYLGKTAASISAEQEKEPPTKKKKKGTKKMTFRFEWDNTDDTLDDADPLYASVKPVQEKERLNYHRSPGRGRGSSSGGGRYNSNNNHRNSRRPVIPEDKLGKAAKRIMAVDTTTNYRDVMSKPLEQMTARDWRIVRENFEISVKGGKAPPPMRSFKEVNLHPALLQAIDTVLRYKDPTPIQRQSIPIGLQRRDLIGIAETGSGKTCAFGVPLLQYVLQLDPSILSKQNVAAEGPLALVLAPTRELALQIHVELDKLLSCQRLVETVAILGGVPIQQQAQLLREGTHVVVGTPGRMNDCLDMAYLVLNQCSYIVLDEADRMVDMGFAPQIEGILDAMGGLMKSEIETEAYQQEEQDVLALQQKSVPKHRVTAMFSATMPMEVERIASKYLRHPAKISIGDRDSSKNARIIQRIVFLNSPSQKENKLRELLQDRRFSPDQKVIVFVNEKKHADGVGRMVERAGRACVVLHGGKSQDEREKNLASFRKGGVVLVATDVAGRGLDIPDVAHVINYDLPSRSIESYTHRIGRTGRAGKEGLATSLLTDEDEGIMAPLKAYLESTGNSVPDRLANHPAVQGASQGNVIH